MKLKSELEQILQTDNTIAKRIPENPNRSVSPQSNIKKQS
mgnify:CR=1 FL=1